MLIYSDDILKISCDTIFCQGDIRFQLPSVVIKKSKDYKMIKNDENIILGQKMVFWGFKKCMILNESS